MNSQRNIYLAAFPLCIQQEHFDDDGQQQQMGLLFREERRTIDGVIEWRGVSLIYRPPGGLDSEAILYTFCVTLSRRALHLKGFFL